MPLARLEVRSCAGGNVFFKSQPNIAFSPSEPWWCQFPHEVTHGPAPGQDIGRPQYVSQSETSHLDAVQWLYYASDPLVSSEDGLSRREFRPFARSMGRVLQPGAFKTRLLHSIRRQNMKPHVAVDRDACAAVAAVRSATPPGDDPGSAEDRVDSPGGRCASNAARVGYSVIFPMRPPCGGGCAELGIRWAADRIRRTGAGRSASNVR